jgi:hypothetical protein
VCQCLLRLVRILSAAREPSFKESTTEPVLGFRFRAPMTVVPAKTTTKILSMS